MCICNVSACGRVPYTLPVLAYRIGVATLSTPILYYPLLLTLYYPLPSTPYPLPLTLYYPRLCPLPLLPLTFEQMPPQHRRVVREGLGEGPRPNLQACRLRRGPRLVAR